MATKVKKNEGEATAEESDVIAFKCRSCEQSKPLDEMMVITRYFPPVILCRDCGKKMHQKSLGENYYGILNNRREMGQAHLSVFLAD